ncbi:PHP domain-containing protein [Sandaracinobacter neustonicus]|uniref:PHP domain-containing protein n=1 Tax=Sandaracinobacter neustonicus TaxID=1715348 RepID=A0A501XPV6_9SPHN|nr:CehA/McbA family metallohydrolase [Sandaracinobacter neustonicus]TPE62284.1 PHP domain-containing protein [Sandaracinobacter neustonicus]
MRGWLAALLLLFAAPLAAADRPADLELNGQISRADHQSYKEVPFTLPPGTDRLLVEMSLDQLEQRTVIDVGLADPNGFRGASGSNKRRILIGETEATPSYLPGAMTPGGWKLILAVPNIREGVTANWQAKLWFLKAGEPDEAPPTAGRGPAWYRGDMHLHSAHSDGSCAPEGGSARVPCPLFLTLQTAAARGLDFVSITEHNSVSHHSTLREAQPFFPRMLLIPGREITTFFGHFNIHGVTRPIDFRIAPAAKGGTTSFNAIADEVHRLGGLLVINHPGMPSDERCMGCGWTMLDVDPTKVDAIEAVNGASVAGVDNKVAGLVDGTPFWLGWQARSGRVTAIGASDNHDGSSRADRLGTVGRPATVVRAADLTWPAIREGLRQGRAFIDIDGVPGRLLDFSVTSGKAAAVMGGALKAASGSLRLSVEVDAPAGTRLRLFDGAVLLAEQPLTGGRQTISLAHSLPAGRHILRLDVVRDGQLILLSNAVAVEIGR